MGTEKGLYCHSFVTRAENAAGTVSCLSSDVTLATVSKPHLSQGSTSVGRATSVPTEHVLSCDVGGVTSSFGSAAVLLGDLRRLHTHTHPLDCFLNGKMVELD